MYFNREPQSNCPFLTFFFGNLKQSGFVRVCQSCEEEAPVGRTRDFSHLPIWFLLCCLNKKKKGPSFYFSWVTISLKNLPWTFTMKWTGEKLMQVRFWSSDTGRWRVVAKFIRCIFSPCNYSSVAGYSEPQHSGDRHNCGAFPARQPRIFIY